MPYLPAVKILRFCNLPTTESWLHLVTFFLAVAWLLQKYYQNLLITVVVTLDPVRLLKIKTTKCAWIGRERASNRILHAIGIYARFFNAWDHRGRNFLCDECNCQSVILACVLENFVAWPIIYLHIILYVMQFRLRVLAVCHCIVFAVSICGNLPAYRKKSIETLSYWTSTFDPLCDKRFLKALFSVALVICIQICIIIYCKSELVSGWRCENFSHHEIIISQSALTGRQKWMQIIFLPKAECCIFQSLFRLAVIW